MNPDPCVLVAHFSDLHYSPKNLAEADRCFGSAVDQAIASKLQVAVISGDSTDHALDLHSPAAARLLAQVRRLADHCPVLMLQGTYSHEPPGTLGIFGLLGGRYPIHVADRIEQVGLTLEGRWIPSDGWRFDSVPRGLVALFSCVPTVNKASMSTVLGTGAAAQALGEHLTDLLRGFASINQRARSLSVPTLGVSHGTVFGCISEHGVPMAGFDHEFTTGALFAAQAQAFLLGHIHRHQSWQAERPYGRQCIAYAGSIGRFHYGEAGDKGFLLWQVGAGDARCALQPTLARRTVDIVFEGRPDLMALHTAIVKQPVEGAFVRVRWTVGEEDRLEIDRSAIQRMLAGATEVKLEGRIVPVLRSRAAGIAHAGNLAEKIRIWAKLTDCRPEPLLACLDALSAREIDTIVADVLRGQDGSRAEPLTGDGDFRTEITRKAQAKSAVHLIDAFEAPRYEARIGASRP